jgi:hypothetical protein
MISVNGFLHSSQMNSYVGIAPSFYILSPLTLKVIDLYIVKRRISTNFLDFVRVYSPSPEYPTACCRELHFLDLSGYQMCPFKYRCLFGSGNFSMA